MAAGVHYLYIRMLGPRKLKSCYEINADYSSLTFIFNISLEI